MTPYFTVPTKKMSLDVTRLEKVRRNPTGKVTARKQSIPSHDFLNMLVPVTRYQ